ncbi:hypothetical protein Taro_047010 [Colocasia esculenta]|uniref:4-coumarate--CoA ligase n=1 Tax=Colocasia esculenta TaxID=4460 RepID=A0A843X4W6_COLES|nr:hypothetical protein [Colocasia esculenta]
MPEMKYLVEVEKGVEAAAGRPSLGPVYRSIFAKDGFPPPVGGMETCWDVFRSSAEKYPGNRMLGRREIVNGKAGKYNWMTYKEVYDIVMKVGASIRSCGVDQGGRCGIYGANCSEWIISMQGNNQQYDLPKTSKDDICTIMYTSGTTGDPKGVLISNESIITLITGVRQVLGCVNEQLDGNDVYLSYLPLAHIFDRVIEETFISHGASIGFWRGDVKLLVEDIGELKPTIFCAVPRVLDRIYSAMSTIHLRLIKSSVDFKPLSTPSSPNQSSHFTHLRLHEIFNLGQDIHNLPLGKILVVHESYLLSLKCFLNLLLHHSKSLPISEVGKE